MLISSAYVKEQRALHQQPAYGSRGFNWAYVVAGIARIEKCATILDYGAGKGTLTKTLIEAGLKCLAYDPAVDLFPNPPVHPFDLVVAVDVLEHIEPACLGDVLAHIARLTKKILFVAISTQPSKRWMTDGRNTHLIVEEGATWWRPLLEKQGFRVRRVWPATQGTREWVAMLEKRS